MEPQSTPAVDLEASAAAMKNIARTKALAAQSQKKAKTETVADAAPPSEPAPAPPAKAKRGRRPGSKNVATEPSHIVGIREAIAKCEKDAEHMRSALRMMGYAS